MKVDKNTCVQQTNCFNDNQINPQKCRLVLSQLCVLLGQDGLTEQQATLIFFSITKLFHSQDTQLRQMVYVAVKELVKYASDVIMLTSSLTRDIQQPAFKGGAIRTLCTITPPSMQQGIQRFLKQAIVDSNVSSKVLCSLAFLDISSVKHLSSEIADLCLSKHVMVQYHAIGLSYLLKQNDRVALLKLCQSCTQIRSPLGLCLIVRYVGQLIDTDPSSLTAWYLFLEGWLHHRNNMVVYEACRVICSVRDIDAKLLQPAVAALQVMLVNHKCVVRFAAVRILSRLCATHPMAVFPCNLDLEGLVTDANRCVATLAITTLLKTGNEESVDRLMKQISGFMLDISEEFKITIVQAIRSLCLKFPAKHTVFLDFLSGCLNNDGGFEFKRSIVDSMFDIVYAIPDAKEYALSSLAEFIEDCDYSKLAVRILALLGAEGPKTMNPSKYIRYIYNRVILENASVRAAAVAALAQFAVAHKSVKPSIQVLLTRCTDDADDEVRDRAAFFLSMLSNESLMKEYIAQDAGYAWKQLEVHLDHYVKTPSLHTAPFDISTVPTVSSEEEKQETIKTRSEKLDIPIQEQPAEAAVETDYAAEIQGHPQLSQLGPIFKSSAPVALTEAETEYVVRVVKHVFAKHLCFAFEITNTLEDAVLDNVLVELGLNESEDEDIALLKPVLALPVDRLECNAPKTAYLVYERINNATPSAVFSSTLKFVVRDLDAHGQPDTTGYDDTYEIEDLPLYIGDYIIPTHLQFESAWNAAGNEVREAYVLGTLSIDECVSQLSQVLGVKTGDVVSSTTHSFASAGTVIGGNQVLVKCRMVLDGTVNLEIAVKSQDGKYARKLVAAIE